MTENISAETYHRIFRMVKRNVDHLRIASTLNLPVAMVRRIVMRIKGMEIETPSESVQASDEQSAPILSSFIRRQARMAVVDLRGDLVAQTQLQFQQLLDGLKGEDFKAIGIKITQLENIDPQGVIPLIALKQYFDSLGRFIALLDPPAQLEPAIEQMGLEEKVPIFGTIASFEKAALHQGK